jgi:acyl-CoA reductase-like NAD-dependent aldehyde dehydrogenase
MFTLVDNTMTIAQEELFGPVLVDVPFGGFKQSGVGRQNGIAGFEQYLEAKSLAWPNA